MKTIAFHNLGCKVNSYELDVMQQIMREKGFEIVPFDQKADVYVINTCTVTNIADRKSRQMLHRAKQKNPEAVVVAVGCYVQTDLEGALKDPAIDLVIGNNRKKDIAQILEEYFSSVPDKTLGGTTVLDIAKEKEYEEMQLKTTAEHTRAYVKIQDGCNQFCSYCAIPLARGRVRSRKAEDILSEIRGVVAAGYLEIVLTGIHVSSYGIDLAMQERKEALAGNAQDASAPVDYRGKTKLFDLIEQIHEIPGLERIRISSLEPRIVTPETAKRLAALPKVCPHFHLSLQSGCDETLKRMNRHYTAQQYLESVQALREAYAPRVPAITTDVIVGFPGETEEEFETTKAFLQKVGFYEMHVFKYSKRKGTRAAVMPDQVPDQVKAERSDVLLALEREQSVAFRRNKLGQTEEVLFEEEKIVGGKLYLLGHTMDYVKVALPITHGQAQKAPKQMGTPERQTPQAPTSGTLCTLTLQEFLTEEILLGHEVTLF
ncbi:MAG: MiaB/RimO family radical SAM methylthiotransferase [Lachnospiraceae bacterium]|nr:MiaB/RimO family radical SAM methylthiotransferase [Lachnospiraceae bacterium]